MDVRKMTSLGQTAAVLEADNLSIGNDCRQLHRALTVGGPMMGVLGSTLPGGFIGAEVDYVSLRNTAPLSYQPSYQLQSFFEINCGHNQFLHPLSVGRFLAAVEGRARELKALVPPAAGRRA